MPLASHFFNGLLMHARRRVEPLEPPPVKIGVDGLVHGQPQVERLLRVGYRLSELLRRLFAPLRGLGWIDGFGVIRNFRIASAVSSRDMV